MIHTSAPSASLLERALHGLAEGVGALSQKLEQKKKLKACCDIPETQCPPRCVANIVWKISRGAAPTAKVVVRNVGKESRKFTFKSTDLVGMDPGTAKVVVSPAQATIAPGETATLDVKLANSESLTGAQIYCAELLIEGAWEQCVKVVCYVERDAFVHCEIEQGEAPTHKHAHHWFDHFTCTHACEPHTH